ncbi:MAG: NERD domain-containing protein [Actinobacteria bacterium]|nr:NERD domain-containing protein [Actinomycetota bacterium]
MTKIRLIPDYVDTNIINNTSEIEVYDILKNSQDTSDWIVLHSLTIPKHATQIFGEIDFLVLAPKLGIFALEVKEDLGYDGKTHYRHKNRYGEYEEIKDPWRQANDNMQSVINYFPLHSWQNSLLFGYGVMIPSSTFANDSIEFEKEVLFDENSQNNPISIYIGELSGYFKNKLLKKNIRKNLPTEEDVKIIAEQLRPKFDCPVLEIEKLKRSKNKIFEFSNDQTRIIDYLVKSPRTLFIGPPGSGKTVLATYSLKRSILQNKRTLFCSFNKLIGYSVKEQLRSYSKNYDYYAGPFNDFLESIVETNYEAHKDKCNMHEYYDTILPALAIEFLQNSNFRKYKYLIVDDAQDIFRENYLKILDLILIDGLREGSWQFYCDFRAYCIFVKDIDIEKAIGTNYLTIPLTINYRNSKRIANEISKVFNLKDYSPFENNEEGKKCKYYYYDSQDEGIKILEEILENIKSKDIPASNITILSAHLSPHEKKNSLVYYLNKKYKVEDISLDDYLFFNTNETTFCSIYRFKGMENSYIIVIDVDNKMDTNILNSLLCTGMSRPLFSLTVLVNNNIRQKTDELFKKHI